MQKRIVEASARWFLPPMSRSVSMRYRGRGSGRLTCEEWSGRDGEDTCEEITRPSVTTGGRSGVWAVGTDHVIDGGHVD